MATIQTKSLTIEVADRGAELQSIKGPDGIEYLWQGDPAFWARRSPVLFPIVGALPGGSYSYGGRTYKLGNHGFAKERDFKLSARSSDALRYELESDEASLEVYPFKFKLAISYAIKGDLLEVGYEVVNADQRRMSFSIGAHPAFRCPVEEGEARDDYDLRFEKAETVDRWFLNSDNVTTGERGRFLDGASSIAVGPDLFERGAIVLKDQVSRVLRLESRSTRRFVELSFPGFPQLGIWAPKANAAGLAPFVCLEPWYGVMPLAGSTQDLERKEAVLALAPGGVFKSAYTIRVG
jgi:galactose mutarotase-like enzyme